jgi:hypothetical protein
MTDLNEYECEMLDTILEAFGVPDSLTRDQLLGLFDNDEATAYAMVQALSREGLIAEAGKPGHYELPERLILKPRGEKFLKEGGFTKRYQLEQQKPMQVGGTLAKLQQQNMRLQNEKLANQTELTSLQETNKKLLLREYFYWVLILVALLAGYLLGYRTK